MYQTGNSSLQNKFPKDQKTQTYSNSISDFPSTTSALLWYLEGEKKKASEAKRQVRSWVEMAIYRVFFQKY